MNRIAFLCGIIVPLPIFFDLLTFNLFINKISENEYSSNNGISIPIGIFSIIFLLLFNIRNVKLLIIFNKFTALSFILLFICFINIDLLRLISIFFPLLYILILIGVASNKIILKNISIGYLLGVCILIFGHFSYIFINYETFDSTYLFYTFYSYEIYQALISYSAVLSMLANTFLILSYLNYKNKLFFIFITLSLISFFIVSMGMRKAALFDLILSCILLLCFIFFDLFNRKINFLKIVFLIFILALIYFLIFISPLSHRELDFEFAYDQRGNAYEFFLNFVDNLSFIQLLFGQELEWGGYSNFFIQLFLSIGIIGSSIYAFLIIFLAILFYKNLFFPSQHLNKFEKYWFILFVLFSFVASNFINMNLQLPFYIINLSFIIIFFSFFYNSFILKKSY